MGIKPDFWDDLWLGNSLLKITFYHLRRICHDVNIFTDLRMTDVWHTKFPLKIQIFLWMMWHDRLQTAT
jgi:hypothetical protein